MEPPRANLQGFTGAARRRGPGDGRSPAPHLQRSARGGPGGTSARQLNLQESTGRPAGAPPRCAKRARTGAPVRMLMVSDNNLHLIYVNPPLLSSDPPLLLGRGPRDRGISKRLQAIPVNWAFIRSASHISSSPGAAVTRALVATRVPVLIVTIQSYKINTGNTATVHSFVSGAHSRETGTRSGPPAFEFMSKDIAHEP
jgi:hypothetical protein